MKNQDYDFSGWASKANVICSDGKTILPGAFESDNGRIVPLVWNHNHGDIQSTLGHALLEARPEGLYAYGSFNDTESGKAAKLIVQHGDVDSMSIFATKLKQKANMVMHGEIKEVSLVLAAANPGAFIESVICHGEESDEAYIYTGELLSLKHSDDSKGTSEEKDKDDDSGETMEEVFNTLNEKQKQVVFNMLGEALLVGGEDKAENNEEDEEDSMKHNLFEKDSENKENPEDGILSHSEVAAIFADAKRYGSLKDAVLQHGIEQIDYLFPEAKTIDATPQFIKRDTGWVDKVMNGVHRTPFARIKSIFADITEDDARAKGYLKGNLKKEEFFSLLKRTTTPTTVYKKQKLDRDDIVDAADFDTVSWMKYEMRMMLDEEIARAILIGDGRLSSSDDKISEDNIRPIAKDAALYTIQAPVNVAVGATPDAKANAFITACIKSRKGYKGSGNPKLYTTEDMITDCLLLKDLNQRFIYTSVEELAKVLRVSEIIAVPVMEGEKGKNGGDLLGVIVNLNDYNVGADKGGAINMFDDFDIDYNALKYLIETRCSGALTKPYSAIALELVEAEG